MYDEEITPFETTELPVNLKKKKKNQMLKAKASEDSSVAYVLRFEKF